MRAGLSCVAACLCAVLNSSCAGNPAAAVSPPPHTAAKGLPFALPRTVLHVELTVVKSTTAPGHFCAYGDLFLGGAQGNVFCPADLDAETETVVKSFTVTPVGVPDPGRTYLLPAAQGAGWAIDTSSAVELSERGLLNAVAGERANRRADVVIGAIRGGAALLVRSIPLAAGPRAESMDRDEDEFKNTFLADWQLIWNFERLTRQKPRRARALVDTWTRRDPSLLAAREAYGDISALTDTYRALLSGKGTESVAVRLAQLKDEIETRTSWFFLGVSESATWSPVFEVDPGKLDVDPEQALRFPLVRIGDCGAALADEAAGIRLLRNPLTASVACPADAADLFPISLSLKKRAPATLNLPDVDLCADSARVLKGIPFVVPADVVASLDGMPLLPGQQVQLSQFGKTSCLTVPRGSHTVAVTYWASTGAIKTVRFTGRSAVTRESVDALSGLAGDVQTAIGEARAKADAEARNRDLNVLRAARERLEERVKIQAACAALKVTCEF